MSKIKDFWALSRT